MLNIIPNAHYIMQDSKLNFFTITFPFHQWIPGLISFIFMHFLRKKWPNNRMAPPTFLGNPGSATAFLTHYNISCIRDTTTYTFSRSIVSVFTCGRLYLRVYLSSCFIWTEPKRLIRLQHPVKRLTCQTKTASKPNRFCSQYLSGNISV